jgi:hypothetical protein
MTDHETRAAEEPPAACSIIESFLDGEPVDSEALRAALDHAEARDHLIELLVLREGVRAMAPVAWTGRTSVEHAVGARVRWLAVAAGLIICLTAGYYTGQRTVTAAEPPYIETSVGLESSPAAPQPTRTIKLEPGVNWTEGPGRK